jgi:hypothetical protein
MNDPVHLDDEKARAGTTRHNVRYVLAISLALVVVIYIGVLLWGNAKAPENPTGSTTISKGEVEK